MVNGRKGEKGGREGTEEKERGREGRGESSNFFIDEEQGHPAEKGWNVGKRSYESWKRI